MLNETLGTWAVKKGGAKKIYSMVSDFGPGHDAEGAFQLGVQGGRRRDRRLGALPGRQSGLLRLRPARQGRQPGCDLHLDSWRRAAGGDRQGAVASAASIRRRPRSSARTSWPTNSALKSMGDVAIGIITAAHYDYNHQSAKSKAFVKALQRRRTSAIRTSSRSAAMTACT